MKIERMTSGSWGKIQAFFDINIDGMIIKGFKLIEGNDGMFVGMPSVKNKDGEYDQTIYMPKPQSQELCKLAEEHYQNNKPTSQVPF